jgi:hypothetical protein
VKSSNGTSRQEDPLSRLAADAVEGCGELASCDFKAVELVLGQEVHVAQVILVFNDCRGR